MWAVKAVGFNRAVCLQREANRKGGKRTQPTNGNGSEEGSEDLQFLTFETSPVGGAWDDRALRREQRRSEKTPNTDR